MGQIDNGFYDVTGFKVTRKYILQLMIDYYNDKYPETQISDFNEGSQIRNLLETISTDIFHLEYNENLLLTQAFLTTASGYYLDLFGEEYGIQRKVASQAQGVITFSISSAVNYPIQIPQNTRITNTETGLFYDTQISAEIPVGATSVTCPVKSMITGSKTNIPANSEFVFYNENLLNEVSISNSESFTGGRDQESDEEYRERLLKEKTSDGFGSKQYYLNLGIIDGVHDIYITSSENDYDGNIIVNGFEKPITDNLLAQVVTIYTNEENLIYNQSFEINKAEFTTVPLEIEITVTDEIQDQTIINVLTNYFNGGKLNINGQEFTHKGININGEITNYDLMTILERINGIIQVTGLTSGDESFNKLTPDTNTALKLGTVTITQNVVV